MIEINKYKLTSLVTPWGEISGDINDQKDLVAFIQEKAGVTMEEVQEWVDAQGFLTEHQDISGLATKEEVTAVEGKIPSLTGYATEVWVEGKGYLTEHQDISGLATKEEVATVEGKIPSLTGYATEEWVEGKGYLTEHQSIKTVNGESIIGEGNVDIVGVTPEQEAALAPLMNVSNGFLYATASLSSRTCVYKNANYFTGTTSGRQTFAVGDDVYYLGKLNSAYFNKIYKFNFDTLEFEEFVDIPEDIKLTYVYPMWKGIDSGVERLYFGGRFEIVDNNITGTGILDGRDYRSNYTHHNVYTFESGNTYLVSFDSASASMYMDGGYFDECEITCPEGLMQQLYQYDCKYNGKQLLIANGVMYELTEVATGSLSVAVVDEPYFPITIDGVNIQGSLFAQIKGKMYYFKNSSNLVYELINGEWTLIDVPGVGTTQKFNTQGAVARDLVFGHGYDTQSTLNVMNLDNSQYGGNTIWKKIDVATKDDITKALGGLESITNEILYK